MIEQKIQAAKLTAPRITPKDLEDNIQQIEIVKFVTCKGKVLRWAVLTTANDFAIVGKPSAAVSVENDNEEIGTEIAIQNSKDELWLPMGYELQSKLKASV